MNLEELKDDKAAHFAIEVANKFSVLEALKEEKTPEDLCTNTQEILLEVARETVGTTKAVKKKTWISVATFTLAKEKREVKNHNIDRYWELEAVVQQILRKGQKAKAVR